MPVLSRAVHGGSADIHAATPALVRRLVDLSEAAAIAYDAVADNPTWLVPIHTLPAVREAAATASAALDAMLVTLTASLRQSKSGCQMESSPAPQRGHGVYASSR